MENPKRLTKHDRIQQEIISACEDLGLEAIQEYRGDGWRADVFVPSYEKPIAFEIQLSPQTLKRTLERQTKYIRDGIIGCWLFENPVSKLNEEKPDLPLFYVEESEQSELLINLGDRRKVYLSFFLENFISNNIRFQHVVRTKKEQLVRLVFYEMNCYKCQTLNHLYYVDTSFYSSCNSTIKPDEALWESKNMEYRPEIIELAQEFMEDWPEVNLRLGQIKKRFSKTVGRSYMSFGCYNCDSIFGDFYVMNAKMEMIYEPQKLTYEADIKLTEEIEMPIPHWCLPDNQQFCSKR